MYKIKNNKGFTLIELMIVVAIIGILSGVALTKVGSVVKQSKEASTKYSLGSMRSALSIYYGSTEEYPSLIDTSPFVPDFIDAITEVKIAQHEESNKVKTGGGIDDTGGWYYDPVTHHVCVNCTHESIKGETISSW